MDFLIGTMIFMSLVLGAAFCFLLAGEASAVKRSELSPARVPRKRRSFSKERLTLGASTSLLGICWLTAVTYFLTIRWESFLAQFDSLIVHVSLQFLTSLALVAAGISAFGYMRGFKTVYFSSMALLVGSSLLALGVQGPIGHGTSTFMYLFTAWVLGIGAVFTTGAFLLDRKIRSYEGQSIPDQEGHYDIDGVSYEKEEVFVGSSPTRRKPTRVG